MSSTLPHPRGVLPSKTMTTAEYLRIHANASPSKLRSIIKDSIFVHDDVAYLKRLVKDVGGMDYVFRFLWYDGPIPTVGCSEGGKQSPSNNTNPRSDKEVVGSYEWLRRLYPEPDRMNAIRNYGHVRSASPAVVQCNSSIYYVFFYCVFSNAYIFS